MSARDYRELTVWQKGVEMAVMCYELADRFPSHQRYVLTSQLRRAAISVPANIAEGNGRLHRGDYVHHLSIARGSLMELATHTEIALRLGYLENDDLTVLREAMDHVGRMLNRLIARLQR